MQQKGRVGCGLPRLVMVLRRWLFEVGYDWVLIVVSIGVLLGLDLLGGGWLLVTILLVYGLLQEIKSATPQRRGYLVRLGVSLLLLQLIFFKYVVPAVSHPPTFFLVMGLPLGISFLTFRLLHVLLEAQYARLPVFGFREYLLYACFFPIWLAGPIQRLDSFLNQRLTRIGAQDFAYGSVRMMFGMIKTFLLANYVLPLAFPGTVTAVNVVQQMHTLSVAQVWQYLLVSYWILYLNFSGYSDLAIGGARCLGFRITENFNFPWLATNLADYWRRWHMSLAQWCQTYIYMPVFAHTRQPTLALFVTFMLLGMWHAASWQWLLWGLYHAGGIYIFRLWDRLVRRYAPQLKTPHGLTLMLANCLTLGYVVAASAFTSLPLHSDVGASFALLEYALGMR